jgi:hypothetical protein
MSAAISITISDSATAALDRLSPVTLLPALAHVLDQENQLTVSHIQQHYLSFPKDGPTTLEGLRCVSNRLRGSIRASAAVVTGAGVQSAIGSNVSYAAAHEFGAVIPPHKITARNGRALYFNIGGKSICVHSVNHPGGVIPARAPIQRGIADRLPSYRSSLSAAILNFARTGGSA